MALPGVPVAPGWLMPPRSTPVLLLLCPLCIQLCHVLLSFQLLLGRGGYLLHLVTPRPQHLAQRGGVVAVGQRKACGGRAQGYLAGRVGREKQVAQHQARLPTAEQQGLRCRDSCTVSTEGIRRAIASRQRT
jgi:hypothetical protein